MSEQLTPKDVKRIEEEIEYRKVTLRPKLLKDLKDARALGDLSENFEYYVAKRENNKNNSRIRYLDKMLRYATIIDDTSAEDEVGMNNTVEVWFPEDEEAETYRIVTPIRANSRKRLISNESPLGKALLGHKKGDRVTVTVEDGSSYEVEIRKSENTGESDDDRISQY